MTYKEFKTGYTEFNSPADCPHPVQLLFEQAKAAAKNAYAPFSGFQVGAALELADGSVYQANNQENPAYPSGLCAERTGLFYVNSNKPQVPVLRMVLVAYDHGAITRDPVYPCGACRQVMVESEDRGRQPMEIWMFGATRIIQLKQAADLLPFKFTFSNASDQ